MKFGNFKKNWSQSVRDNTSKNLIIAVLLVVNVVAVIGWARTEQTIVLVPAVHDERLEISASSASVGYKKAWALTVAQLAGNITPGNADLVLKTMGDLLAPDAYRRIAAELAGQINDIKRDSLTVSFEPRQIVYEPSTEKVFVTGQFSSQGVSGAPLSIMRTYEMQVDIRFGRPWVTTFKPYQGSPATADNLKQRVTRASAESGGA